MERSSNFQSFRPFRKITCVIGVWVACITILILPSLPFSASAQRLVKANNDFNLRHSQAEKTILKEGTQIEREMKGGETHSFQIAMVGGHFFYAVIEQKGIDVAVKIIAPNNQLIAMADSPNGVLGPEPAALIAEVSGDYRLEVSSSNKSAIGRYEVRVVRLREATNKDKELLAAHRDFQQGWQLQRQGSATSIRTAIDRFEQSLSLFHSTEDQYWEAFSAFVLGSTYTRISDYHKALRHSENALALFKSLSLKNQEARTLNLLGGLNDFLGNFPKALGYYQEALSLVQILEDRSQQASILNNIGKIQSDLGNLQEALDRYNQALSIYRITKNKLREGIAQHNIGVVYNLTGDSPKALEQLTQALAIRREMKDKLGEADTFSEIGYSYKDLGKSGEALDHFNQALSIRKAVGDANGEAFDLNSVSLIYANLGQTDKSLDFGLQALNKMRAIGDRRNEALITNNLGHFYTLISQPEKAIDYYNQAFSIFSGIQDKRNISKVLIGLARAEQTRGNSLEAIKRIKEAISYIEQVREGVSNYQQLRTSYLASSQDAYQLYIDLLMQQHRLTPSDGRDGLALEISEQSRARSLLNMLAEGKADIRQGVDITLIEREHNLMQLLNTKAQRQIQLLSQKGSKEQLTELNKEISTLEDDYQRVQAAIRKASPRYAALTQPQPLNLKDIQQQVLDKDVLLLEYSLGEERSYLWAVTSDSITSYELPKRELIREAAQRVTELLTARGTRQRNETPPQRTQRIAEADAALPEAAKQLSDMILAPAADRLANRRLLVVPDGALQYVPFASLPVAGGPLTVAGKNPRANQPPTTDYRPLILDHEIVTLPSASTLAVMRKELAGRQPAPKMLAVFADPVFADDDERRKAKTAQTDSKPGSKAGPKVETPDTVAAGRNIVHEEAKAFSTGGIGGSKMLIQRLPFTRQEADRILAITPNSANLKAVDFKANRALATGSEIGQYRYLHFATHSLPDAERANLSALVLSLVDEQGKPQDGFLRVHEIYNLNLPAELVVLSACQTGLGKEYKGEGLVGLTRGFMYAGAARVVVSLWNVNDRATSELMPRFYQKMLKEGQSPAAALRSAQVEMWRQKQWTAPYYWAAFVLQGEWK